MPFSHVIILLSRTSIDNSVVIILLDFSTRDHIIMKKDVQLPGDDKLFARPFGIVLRPGIMRISAFWHYPKLTS